MKRKHPIFPIFKKIELNDRKIIQKFIKKFPPYNDFEFTSLWTYNTIGENTFSTLHDNLIIKIQDFITGKFFYSFLGLNNVIETSEILIQKCKEDNITPSLRLIPEDNIKDHPHIHKSFLIREDLDSFEYILSVNEVAELKGSKYHDKRNLVNKFKNSYPGYKINKLDLTNKDTQLEIIKLFHLWKKRKNKKKKDVFIEFTAIKKLFELTTIMNISGIGVYYKNKLIGFSSIHTVHNKYALLSFTKADTSYKGIYELLNQEAAKYLKTKGVLYINFEQDLGIPGLKKAKMLWRPVFFFKKYTISELI